MALMQWMKRWAGGGDDRDGVRPLWHRVVAVARAPGWYARAGIADTVPGRFDAITLVLALVLLRMERSPALAGPAVMMTELFVDDMDGQLRESGVGDLLVGKHIGRLMSVLGGRLGALRETLAAGALAPAAGDAALAEALARNVTLVPGADVGVLVREVRALDAALAALDDAALLAGEVPEPVA